MSSNRFTPLTNPNENQTVDINPRTNCEWPLGTNFTKKKIIQPSAGNKIPTIINGKITNAETKKPSSSLKNSSVRQQLKSKGDYNKKISNKKQNKIIILGDSHARGCAQEVQHNLGCDFEVQGIVKPGANTEIIVNTSPKITKKNSQKRTL